MQGRLFGSKLSIRQIFSLFQNVLECFVNLVKFNIPLCYFLFNNRVKECRDRGSSSTATIPSVPLGVMELLLTCELSRLGPFGDSLLPLTRLCGLARSCISIDLTRHTHTPTPNPITHFIQLQGRHTPLMLKGNKQLIQIIQKKTRLLASFTKMLIYAVIFQIIDYYDTKTHAQSYEMINKH